MTIGIPPRPATLNRGPRLPTTVLAVGTSTRPKLVVSGSRVVIRSGVPTRLGHVASTTEGVSEPVVAGVRVVPTIPRQARGLVPGLGPPVDGTGVPTGRRLRTLTGT